MNQKQHRRSIRIKGYNYASSGAYFITICTNKHEQLFGEIVNGKMELNECGKIVQSEWIKTGILRSNIEIDAFIIMPNHIHGIIFIHDDSGVMHHGHGHRDPTYRAQTEQFGKPTSNTIPTIIRGYKSAVTSRINKINNTPRVKVWQRNYWEHIIRNDQSMNHLQEYIQNNPIKWHTDCFYKKNQPPSLREPYPVYGITSY